MDRQKNVLVVGGAGFIGSHTCLALQEAGYNVIIYDNFSTGHRDTCFASLVVEGELSDRQKLADTMREYDISGVIHFAALIEAGQSVVDPFGFYRNNVASTLSLLEAMCDADVHRIVFSSTAAVYGDQAAEALLSEDLPHRPINPYGHSKAMVEVMLESGAAAYGLQAIALRYFNASGADPQGRTGERHDPETHLIPLVIQAALGQRESIKIFGTDYPTADGTCIRDYIHVSDLAAGHVAALTKLEHDNAAGFRMYNLGTGQGYSVSEVIEAVKEISGRSFDIVKTTKRGGDPARLVADARAAFDELEWRPERSGLPQIVQDAWSFFSRQHHG